MDLEADLRPGEHNGENQEPPKTRSFSEDHLERGRQRLQGAKLSHRQRHKPQPAESRAGYQRQPQTKQRGKNSRRLAAAGRITASAPAAPGRHENRQAEAEASPEGEVSKPKRQPADRRQSRAGGPGSGPTARGAQWREPRTSQDPQLQ